MTDSKKKTVKAPESVETPAAELEAGGLLNRHVDCY